jgi:hypothetical protein
MTESAQPDMHTASQGGAGMLTSWAPGRHQTSASWPQVAEEIS